MDSDKTVRVLILEDSVNDAELVASQLKNSGLAVRSYTAEDEEQTRELVTSQSLDMVLCALQSIDPDLEQVIQLVQRSEKDIPVLVLDEQYDAKKIADCLQAGAAGYLGKDDPELLSLLVKRELDNLKTRRRLRQQEATVREFERRCHALLDSSRDAITYIHEGMHLYANQVYLELFGFTDMDEVDGTPILDIVAPDDHQKFKEFLKNYTNSEESRFEIRGLKPDGSTFNAMMEFSPASIDGEPCTQIIIRAQANDKELEKKLKFLSKQDVLTCLYNRQYFLEELEQAFSNAVNGTSTAAVMYIEPDNFKQIKENIGIAGADLVLGDIANIIREQTDESMVCARFGDHSFTVLLPTGDTAQAESLAEVLRTAVEHYISDVQGKSVTYTVSIGVSIVGETATSAQDILTKADLACEMMHKEGGNRIHIHNPVADLQASKDRDQYWGHMIRDALENNRFKLVYQPIVSLLGETEERYEVLIRMQDEEGSEIMPAQFLPIAEKSDLIVQIDRWVIFNAAQILADRRAQGHDTIFFIKLTGRTLADETLLPWISSLLQKMRLPGNAFVFEISEPVAVTYLKHAKVLLQGLSQVHCGFGLEDFGNGMNSFQLLKHLPVNYLKIDGAFVHNLSTNKENQTIVKSIVEMASALGKPVIAEFVEDANSLTFLWQSGVQFIQGNFLQSPDEAMNYDFHGEAEEEERRF